jgi:sortase (surface protein transpeptidase)
LKTSIFTLSLIFIILSCNNSKKVNESTLKKENQKVEQAKNQDLNEKSNKYGVKPKSEISKDKLRNAQTQPSISEASKDPNLGKKTKKK